MGAETERPGGRKIYAIVRSGGKQYRVEPGQLIDVDRLPADVGSTVELADVLLIAHNGDVRIGQPTVDGARVVAEVVDQGRDAKIVVFKYKAKTRYRRRRGHRQGYTRLAVRQILTSEGPVEAEEKPKRRRRAKAEEKEEAKPVRRTRARKAEAEAPSAEAETKPARRKRVPKAEAEVSSAKAPVVEAAEAEEKPVRRTRARKTASEGEAKKKPRRVSSRKTKTESD